MQTLLDVAFAESDWLDDTAFRALQRLYHHYLSTETPLVDDDAALAGIARLSLEAWQSIADQVRQFFRAIGGKLYHAAIGRLIQKAHRTRKSRAEAGRAGGLQRVLNLNGMEANACHPSGPDQPRGNIVMGKFGRPLRNPYDSKDESDLFQANASARPRGVQIDSESVPLPDSAPLLDRESRVERGVQGGGGEPLRLAAPVGADAPTSHTALLEKAAVLWNEMASRTGRPVPMLQAFHRGRQRALSARFKEIRELMGAAPLDGWKMALAKFEASDWCTGRATGRASTFDQITRPGEFWRLLEGHFDNRPTQGINNGRTQTDAASSGRDGFATLYRKLRAAGKIAG